MRLRVRGTLVPASALIVLALTGIAGLLVVQAIRPHISVEEASAAAISQIQQMNTGSKGTRSWAPVMTRQPDRVYDDRGNLIYSESRSACLIGGIRVPSFLCHAEAAWILHLRAPAQGAYRSYDAYVVVNATTGRVSSASVTGT